MLIQLLDYLQSGKTYSIQELADLLHKDMDSVRVELEYLENQGHVFPPFFLCRSPRKGFLPHSCGVFQRWHAPRTSGHFVPKWLVAVLPLPGYSFSDGHSFFKVQLIDELP